MPQHLVLLSVLQRNVLPNVQHLRLTGRSGYLPPGKKTNKSKYKKQQISQYIKNTYWSMLKKTPVWSMLKNRYRKVIKKHIG